MELEILPDGLTVCQVRNLSDIDLKGDFYFIGKTDQELSLVCPTAYAPVNALSREDGWRGFRIKGTLDFSLVGVLSRLSGFLAAGGVGLFAVSTYNTDYILVKQEHFRKALEILTGAGYRLA